MMRLEEWCVTADPFRAPECGGQRLSGRVYGHPEAADGKSITTSPIVRADGCLVTTSSGSVYELGAPDADYLAFLADIGHTFDAAQPVKVRRVG